MSYSSCIAHPANNRYLQIHEWQIKFCQGSHCAALLLSFFSGWHDWKIKNDHYYRKSNDIAEMHGDGRPNNENAYLFFSMEELIEGCMGFYGKNTVNDAIDALISLQVITVHKNPNPRYHFDKTKYFKFYPDVCNRWIAENYGMSKKSQEDTQVIDYIDTPKEANRSTEKGRRSAEKGQPTIKMGQAITYTTNNTTNKNKSIKAREDFFDDRADIQPVISALTAKGFPEERFQYPDTAELIEKLLAAGATPAHFEMAYDLAEQATRGRGNGFGVRYLAKTVGDFLSKAEKKKLFVVPPQKPPNTRSNPVYESDFTNGMEWLSDIIEEYEEDIKGE